MDHVVVDVEIQKTIEETPGGWDATNKLGVACAVLYEFNTDRYLVYRQENIEQLQQRLHQADRISGYNIWKFDFPVIFSLPGRERVQELESKIDDLLRRIWQALGLNPDSFSRAHGGWGLDAVAGATLGEGKSGHGADAPKWWQEGEWDKVVSYCIDDVRLERNLTSFVDKYGYVINHKKPNPLFLPEWSGHA